MTSGQPHSQTIQGRGPPSVSWNSPHGSVGERRRTPSKVNTRTSRTIVQVIMLATSAFALLDLYLLSSSGLHH
ncbi:MAG TPA: hypothetical protein VIJ09_04580 [Acidimicrobiales bacterium]